MITIIDLDYKENSIKGRYFYYKEKLQIIEYTEKYFTIYTLGPSEECEYSLNDDFEEIPYSVKTLDEAIQWLNYYIERKNEN